MQKIYCGLTEFNGTTVIRDDPVITVYGDSNNSTITSYFITNLAKQLNSLSILEFREITRIEDNALSNLQVSKFELILPDTLEYIGEYAFQNCTAVNYIVIPSSVTYIGKGAFYDCASLNHIYFREGSKINYIPEFFCSGGGLNSVGIAYNNGTFTSDEVTEFPESIKTINNKAFYNCGSMGYILKVGNNIQSIGDYAFYETVFDTIEIGSGINTGNNQEGGKYEEGGYDTDRDIILPYTLYLSSKRQFRYKHIDIEKDAPSCTIYLTNKKEYEEKNVGKTYTYRTDDDDFKFCLNSGHFLVFKNGLLLPNTYYYIHSIINNPISDVGVVLNVSVKTGDYIDIFYVTNDLKHMEVEYYDMDNKIRYLQNGKISIANNDSTEYRNMGDQIYPDKKWMTNYIKLCSPLYAISSKHSTFVFLNGKKVRFDELEDISDTIMSINTDYARSTDLRDSTMNAVRLEVMNHLDTQDIIEQLYINDGLSHEIDYNYLKGQFNLSRQGENANVYKSTHLIKSIDLTKLEAYAKRTLLDEILNDLSDENLNKLFYDYKTATGPMTKYNELIMNEPNFAKKEDVINAILQKYFINTTAEENNTSDDTQSNTDGTVFYDNTNDDSNPSSFDGNNV